MLAPNNSGSWSNQTLIYVGDFATSASQSFACFLDLLIGLQIRPGLIAFPTTPLLFSFVFVPLLSSILWITPASGFVFYRLILSKRCFSCFYVLDWQHSLIWRHVQNTRACVHPDVAGAESHTVVVQIHERQTNNLFVCHNHCSLMALHCQLPINQWANELTSYEE